MKQLLLFTSQTCATCKPLKAALKEQRITYTEVDCHKPESFDLMRQHSVRGMPTSIVIELETGEVVGRVTGNDIKTIKELLR